MPPSSRPAPAWDSSSQLPPSYRSNPPSYRTNASSMGSRAGGAPPSYRSTASSIDFGAGNVPFPYPVASSGWTPSSSHPHHTSSEPDAPSEHSNFGYGSEDGSASECGSMSSYAGYGSPTSATFGRSGMTDMSGADTDLREYRGETPRRPGGFRRTPLSEDEQTLAMVHMAQQLLNPTPSRALGRPGAQEPILPSQQSSNRPGLVPVGEGGSNHLCPIVELRATIRYAAEYAGMTIRGVSDIADVLHYWADSEGSIMARKFLQSGLDSWFSVVGQYEPCSCGRWRWPDWWNGVDFIGSLSDTPRGVLETRGELKRAS